ncbi:MAG TPA: hypothetical protein VLA74_13480 [Nitrososphaeraceae archaeon]|nr:hypothetical protein [Nitrososphaeraceae archaeon]
MVLVYVILPKHWNHLRTNKEVMFLFGIGFRDLDHVKSITNTKGRVSAFIIDETVIYSDW